MHIFSFISQCHFTLKLVYNRLKEETGPALPKGDLRVMRKEQREKKIPCRKYGNT